MVSKELDELFAYVNESITYIKAIEKDNRYKAEDSILACCDNCYITYDKLIDIIDYLFKGEYKVEKEVKTASKWSITRLEDVIEDINDWTLPDTLYFFKKDEFEDIQYIKNDYVAYANDLLELLYE